MARSRFGVAALLLGGLILTAAGCAPNRAIVRGNWPDGRLQAPTRISWRAYLPPAPPPVEPPALPAEEWLPAEPIDDGLSAADLNRRGVLQPVYFDFDRAVVRPDQVAVLEANAAWLAQRPAVRVIVEGHCDERGTREYNLALGARRAEAARDFLVALGVSPERIETVSYGEELPADPAHNERAWALNRRAETVIVSTGAQ